MRKIRLALLAALVAVSFAACGEKKAATDDTTTEDKAKTEEPAPAPALNEGDQFVADYAKLVDDLIAVTEKSKSGDATAVQESQKLMQSFQEWGVKVQEMAGKLTPEQQQKLQEIAQKYADAAMKAAGQ